MQIILSFLSMCVKGHSCIDDLCWILLEWEKKIPKRHILKLKTEKANVYLRAVEWVHGLFLFPLVLGKM